MAAIALIPARGGSKRLPRKNVRPFAGRPLLTYSIQFAHDSTAIGRCVVSTDDEETARIARQWGATVVVRPPALATDTATSVSVAVHALQTLRAEPEDVVVLLQPNCPLRPRRLIDEALTRLDRSDADSIVTVSPHHHKTGGVTDGWFVPDYVSGTRSQDLPARYFENGVLYVTRAAVVLEQGSLFGSRIGALVTDPIYALGDIDTALDWEVAEHLFTTHPELFGWMAGGPPPSGPPQVPRA